MVHPFTWIIGIVLILVGIAGFFVDGNLLWFQVDTVHNVIHLASGVIALAAVMSSGSYARLFLLVFGVVYALVTIIGLITGGSIIGLFTVNSPDNFLHAVIAVCCLTVGFSAR